MAAKSGMAFNSDQIQTLVGSVKALANNLEATMDSVGATFNKVDGDEIIGESENKAPIHDAIKDTKETVSSIKDKLIRMNATMDQICETIGVSIKQNTATNEEAASALHAAATKAKEATGDNA